MRKPLEEVDGGMKHIRREEGGGGVTWLLFCFLPVTSDIFTSFSSPLSSPVQLDHSSELCSQPGRKHPSPARTCTSISTLINRRMLTSYPSLETALVHVVRCTEPSVRGG